MDAKKRGKLRRLGGRTATVSEFINLSEPELAVVDLRLKVAAALRKQRTGVGMTQATLARANW